MRPILRPGTHLLRRHDREVQLGLAPEHAVVLPDEEPVRRCLQRLGTAVEVTEFPAEEAGILNLLAENGLLVDADALLPLLASDRRRSSPSPTPADVAALARRAGDETAALLRSRAQYRLGVTSFGVGGKRIADRLVSLLAETGLRVVQPRPDRAPPVLMVLAGVGEPHRELSDDSVRRGTPHLLVRFTEGEAVVGPFVAPGETACLRCLDAHHTDVDQSWPLVVSQYASRSARDHDYLPEPGDTAVSTLALAWAARDLVAYVERRRPSTWSTTLRLSADPGCLESQTWPRHPACGCSWDRGEAPAGFPAGHDHRSATMGA